MGRVIQIAGNLVIQWELPVPISGAGLVGHIWRQWSLVLSLRNHCKGLGTVQTLGNSKVTSKHLSAAKLPLAFIMEILMSICWEVWFHKHKKIILRIMGGRSSTECYHGSNTYCCQTRPWLIFLVGRLCGIVLVFSCRILWASGGVWWPRQQTQSFHMRHIWDSGRWNKTGIWGI